MNNIKEARMAKGISQGKLAEMLNTAQRNVSNYENDLREASYDILIQIADICEVTIDYLLCRNTVNNLSKDEEKLLQRYRSLDDEGKELVLAEALRQQQRIAASPTETAAV